MRLLTGVWRFIGWDQLPYGPWRASVLAAVVMIMLVAPTPNGRVMAQDDEPSTAPPSPESLMADQMLVLVMRQLFAPESEPTSHQLVCARILLDLALGLDDTDPEMWQLRLELARREGDREAELHALRTYCRLVPGDDAAQFDLALELVGTRQTLAERAGAIRGLLAGPDATQLSGALRSRLASYVAEAALESGDVPVFAEMLKEAVDLDPTNTHAAAMTHQWALSQDAPTVTVGQALLNLVKANPLDPISRRRLAELLISQGAYAAASKQFEAAVTLSQDQDKPYLIHMLALSLAGSGRVGDTLNVLSQFATYSHLFAPREQVLSLAGNSSRDQAALPEHMELLQYVACLGTEHETKRDASLFHLRSLLEQRQAEDQTVAVDLAWLSILADQEGPTVESLNQIAQEVPTLRRHVTALIGWTHLRHGDMTAARETLLPLAADDPVAAYGIAHTYVKEDSARYVELLQRVIAMAPVDVLGVLAAKDIRATGIEPAPSQSGRALSILLEDWSTPLLVPDIGERPWTGLSVQVDTYRYAFLQPVMATISLHNLTDLPLSLGLDGAIPTRCLINLSTRRAGAAMPPIPPMVVDLGRGLSIGPRGKLEVRLRLDRGALGSLLSSLPFEKITFGASAVLDPTLSGNGGIVPGPAGAKHSIHLIERSAAPPARNIERWIEQLGSRDRAVRFPALALLGHTASLLKEGTKTDSSKELRERIELVSDAVNRVYNKLGPVGQAWMVRFTPAERDLVESFSTVHELAQRSDEPLVKIVYMATHIRSHVSPILRADRAHTDPLISAFADAYYQGLFEKAEAEASDEQPDQEG